MGEVVHRLRRPLFVRLVRGLQRCLLGFDLGGSDLRCFLLLTTRAAGCLDRHGLITACLTLAFRGWGPAPFELVLLILHRRELRDARCAFAHLAEIFDDVGAFVRPSGDSALV